MGRVRRGPGGSVERDGWQGAQAVLPKTCRSCVIWTYGYICGLKGANGREIGVETPAPPEISKARCQGNSLTEDRFMRLPFVFRDGPWEKRILACPGLVRGYMIYLYRIAFNSLSYTNHSRH